MIIIDLILTYIFLLFLIWCGGVAIMIGTQLLLDLIGWIELKIK